jgi:hypothetical protein
LIEFGAPDPAGNGVEIYHRFRDEKGAEITAGGRGWVGGGITGKSDTEWQDRESVVTVPAGAKELEFEVIFRSAHGEVRFDDGEVVPVLAVSCSGMLSGCIRVQTTWNAVSAGLAQRDG